MRRRWALCVVLLVAGCGSAQTTKPRQPTLPRALAQSLRRQADSVAAALAAGDGCLAQQRAVALQTSVIRAVNARRLQPRFQETLVGSVNDLVSRIRCVPPPVQPAAAPVHGPPKHEEHHKPHGHGKHGDEGD
jgi:hypothetical protein